MNSIKPTATARKIVSNFSWITAGNVIDILLGLFIGIAVTRYLGVRNIGIYSYAFSFSSMIGVFANVGVNNIATKRYASGIESHEKNTTVFLVLMGLGGIACFLTAAISSYFVVPTPETRGYILIIMVSYLFTPLQSMRHWLLAKSQAKHVSLVQTGGHLVCRLARLLLIILKAPLIWFIVAAAAEGPIVDVGLAIVTKARFSFPKPVRASKRDYLDTLKVCVPFMLSTVAITIYMRVDQVMIGNMLGEYDLGLYSTAVKLAEYWYFIPGALFTAVLPILTKTRERDNAQFLERLQMFSDVIMLLAYGVAIVMSVFSGQILRIFGEEYVAAGGVLSVYIWAGIAVTLGYVRGIYCMIHEYSVCEFVASVIGVVANIICNLILIPVMGMLGAVVATLLTQFLSSLFINVMFRQTRHELFAIQVKALFPFVRLVGYAKEYLRKG